MLGKMKEAVTGVTAPAVMISNQDAGTAET